MSADEEIAPEDLDVGEEGGEEVMDEVRFLQFTQPHSIERTTVSLNRFLFSPFPPHRFFPAISRDAGARGDEKQGQGDGGRGGEAA